MAEARGRLGGQRPARGWWETGALVLVPFGALIPPPPIGWAAGVIMLWRSPVWTTREKLIGTFVLPGGVGVAFGYLFYIPTEVGLPEWSLFVMLYLMPIASAIYLRRKLAARSPSQVPTVVLFVAGFLADAAFFLGLIGLGIFGLGVLLLALIATVPDLIRRRSVQARLVT